MNKIKLALRLFRCVLLHGMIERREGYRCPVCRPVRKRRTQAKTSEAA
ncbi:MAG: hypothetical protein ABIG68_02080 [Acidobacteriota bacterium]